MKLKTRLAVAFLTITIVPLLLFYAAVMALSSYQAQAFRKEYGLTEQIDLFSGNSLQVFNRLTSRAQQDIREEIEASLIRHGMEITGVYDAWTFDPPRPDSERLVFVARMVHSRQSRPEG